MGWQGRVRSGRDVRVVPVLEVGTDRVERLTELRLVARAHGAALVERVDAARIAAPDHDLDLVGPDVYLVVVLQAFDVEADRVDVAVLGVGDREAGDLDVAGEDRRTPADAVALDDLEDRGVETRVCETGHGFLLMCCQPSVLLSRESKQDYILL